MTDINSKTLSMFLNCFLCGRQYRHPCLLWCLHSYCESCLTEYIKDFQKATKNLEDKTQYNLTCPQCTTEVESSKMNGTEFSTSDFPRNFFTERLIQYEWGDGKTPGNRTEKSRAQNAQPFPTNKEPTNARIPTCCQRARDQTLNKTDLYCVDCDIILCNICHITDHTRHRCATLQAVSTNFGQKVNSPIHQITSQIKHLQIKYETVKENQESCHSNLQRIQSQIKERTVSLIELVKDYEKLLLEKTDENHKSAMKHLDNQEQAIAAHISALSSALNFTKILRQYGTDEEKVSLRKMVGKRLQELCDEQVEYEINRVKSYTLQKSKISQQHIGKIYGALEETAPSDSNRKSTFSELPTGDTDTLQKPKVCLKHIGKIHGDFQGETTLNDMNRKTMIREPFMGDTQSIGCNSSKQNKLMMTNNRKIPYEDTTNEQLRVCEPIWETQLPGEISQYGLRGMGYNSLGNLVIGASLIHGQAVYIVDGHCGKVMDRYIIDDGWTLHTITSTGKGVLYLARGRCKFKVKILECLNGIKNLQETQIECVGINTITVDAQNQLIIAANRYIDDSELSGKAIKSDTNITIYDSQTGTIKQRLTKQMYKNQDIGLLQQPEYLLSAGIGDILFADSGCHSVARLNSEGKVLFNCKVSEGPNLLCVDRRGNILVGYKHKKMVTVLTKTGEAKSFLLTEVPKFFVIGKENNLLVLDSTGTIWHFNYNEMLKD